MKLFNSPEDYPACLTPEYRASMARQNNRAVLIMATGLALLGGAAIYIFLTY